MKQLTGDALVAQNLLQVIFDGGCADTCVGKCACRSEIVLALALARQEGREEVRNAKRVAEASQDDAGCRP